MYMAHDQLVMIGDWFRPIEANMLFQEVMAEFVDVIGQVTSERLSDKWGQCGAKQLKWALRLQVLQVQRGRP